MIELIELDKRYRGHGTWKYCINFYGRTRINEFSKIRQWCWETWGASKEISESYDTVTFSQDGCNNPRWCWRNENFSRRLYLRGDEEAILLTLRWV